MSGVSLTANASDFSRVDSVLANAINGDGRVLMSLFGDYVLSETLLNFDDEQTPEGKEWKQSQRARDTGGKTLQHRGHLRDSYTYNATDSWVVIGSNIIYAAIHHFGGKAGRNKTVDIDARPALGITPKMETEMGGMYTQWAAGLFA